MKSIKDTFLSVTNPGSAIIAAFGFLTVLSCTDDKLARQYESLPELPEELLAILDTTTMTMRAQSVYAFPQEDTAQALLAPCCSIREEKRLKVTYRYVRCAPLHEFIVVDLDNLVLTDEPRQQPDKDGSGRVPDSPVMKYKYSRSISKNILDWLMCFESNGPWDATLTENRACSPYTPHQNLQIALPDQLLVFQWAGGVEGHPAEVGLVSCRDISTTRLLCPGGLSTCDCSSSTCPATSPCPCGIENEW